jgi:hypothetical protein
VVHSDCLRQFPNVRVADQHSMQHLWSQCGTVGLAAHLAAHRLKWLGHMLRTGQTDTYTRCCAHSCINAGVGPREAPHISWEKVCYA